MSLRLTWQEGVDVLLRNRYSLTLIGALVFLPADLVFALLDPSRGWSPDVAWSRVVLALLVLGAATALAYGAAIAAIAVEPEGDHEEPRTPLASLADAGRRYGTLLALTLVLTLGIVGGLLLLVVPGVLLLVWWFVAFQAAIVEGRGSRSALRRSRALAHGSFWQLLVLAVLLIAVTVAVDYVLWRVGVELLPDVLGAWFGGAIADTVNVGLLASFVTAAYWQLNERSTLREPS